MSTINAINQGWVEITNPLSRELFYANTETGEVTRSKPQDANLLPEDSGEWWELWDDNYNLPYYYNTITGQTKWTVPETGNLISLTKVQNSLVGRTLTLTTSSYFDDQETQSNNADIKRSLDEGNLNSSMIDEGPFEVADRYFPRDDSLVKSTKGNENKKYEDSSDGERNDSKESVTASSLSSAIYISQIKTQTTSLITNSQGSAPSSPSKKGDKYFISNDELYAKDNKDFNDTTQHPLKDTKITPLSSSENLSSESSFKMYTSGNVASKSNNNLPNEGTMDKSDHKYRKKERRKFECINLTIGDTASIHPVESPKSPISYSSPPLSPRSVVSSTYIESPTSPSAIAYQMEDWYSPLDYTSDKNHRLPVNESSLLNSTEDNHGNFDDKGVVNNTYKEIEGFVQKYFNKHKVIFSRTDPIETLLLFQKEELRQPLITMNPQIKKDAIRCFKSIQRIMGDRPMKKRQHRGDLSPTSYNDNPGFLSLRLSPSMLRLLEETQWLLDKGISNRGLRDEIYMQISKQLTNNFNSDSVRRGWELLCVIAVTFPPTKHFESYVLRFIKEQFDKQADQVDVYSRHVFSRLERTREKGSRGKVLTLMEIKREMETPFNPSIFGESLDFIMKLQEKTDPGLRLDVPRILPFLAHSILKLKGQTSEGIFRVPGVADQVVELRLRIEYNDYDITGISDPNVPASLLKSWLRDLIDPLIPNEFYERCIRSSADIYALIGVIKRLPEVNRKVTVFIIRFLQIFLTSQVVDETNMDVNNISMVFAPNFLRCPTDIPSSVFMNTIYEQLVVKTLLMNFKPSDVEDDEEFGFNY